MRDLKFQVYKAIAGWLLIIASVKHFCSSQKYIFYVAKKKCSDIGNIGNKSTDTDIVILGLIYRYPIYRYRCISTTLYTECFPHGSHASLLTRMLTSLFMKSLNTSPRFSFERVVLKSLLGFSPDF